MRSTSIEDYIKAIYRIETVHERATTQRFKADSFRCIQCAIRLQEPLAFVHFFESVTNAFKRLHADLVRPA